MIAQQTRTGAKNFTVSARDLASLAGPEPCPACFRIRLLTKGAFPYQVPTAGLVYAVDRLAKLSVRGTLDREKRLPSWVPDLGPVTGYVRNVDARWFREKDRETGITVIGVPDDVLVLEDGSVHVVDYKAARFTPAQEMLLPLYEAQVNVYAWIANRLYPYVPGPASRLTLLYLENEPVDGDGAEAPSLHFSARPVPVTLTCEHLMPELLRWARLIHDAPERVLRHREGCREFEKLTTLVDAQVGRTSWAPALRREGASELGGRRN